VNVLQVKPGARSQVCAGRERAEERGSTADHGSVD